MNYFFPGYFGLSEEAISPAQATPFDETPMLSPAGVMYSTLLQLRTHVKTEKSERTNLSSWFNVSKETSLFYSPRLSHLTDHRQVSLHW